MNVQEATNEYSPNDIQLLLTLQKEPLQSYSKIAEDLDKSVKTISRWVKRLEDNNLFSPVRALISYSKLNLEICEVVVEIKDLTSVKKVEKFCDAHPYTAYRSRINGAINGLHIEFIAPKGSKNYYKKILDELKNRELIFSFKIFDVIERAFSTKFNLTYWNNDRLTWIYNWESWHSKLNSNDLPSIPQNKLPTFDKELFDKLDQVDICLIRLLNENAKMKLKDMEARIEEHLNVKESVQRISERVKVIKEHFIHENRLSLNFKTLNIYNRLILDVRCNKTFTNKIRSLMHSNPPPFPSRLFSTTDGFIWYINIPTSDFSKFLSIFWNSEVEKYNVSFIDYTSVQQYAFWEQNYDPKIKDWKKSEEHIVDIPLKSL